MVNGLNPGRFDTSKEDDETTALTLILSPVSAQIQSNFNQMVTFAELLASKLELNPLGFGRNPLTQQMIDHYSHQAEDFDLRNFT